MDRLAPQELKRSNIQRPYIRFEQTKASSRDAVIVQGLSKSFGDLKVLQNVNLEIMRGDKVAIIGGNGVGKTTLIRCLMGEIEPDAGTVRWGHGMDHGYYPQDSSAEIEPGKTALEWILQFEPEGDVQIVRGLLGRMLFTGDEPLKQTTALSGGETARLLERTKLCSCCGIEPARRAATASMGGSMGTAMSI